MNIALIVVGAYMALIIGIAVFSNRRMANKDSAGYLLAGQRLPWYLVAVMVTGLAVGGASTVGVAEQAYTAGLSAGWYTLAWSCAAVVFGLLISNKVRRYNMITVSGLIKKVFGKTDGMIAILMQVLLMFGINATQIVAGGAILSALMPEVFNMAGGMVVSTLVYILTSCFGGYLGASITNCINVVVIYAGLITSALFSINHFGGWTAIRLALPSGAHWFDCFSGVGPAVIAGWIITMVMTAPPNQMLFQASAAAKDERQARKGFLAAALLMGPTGVLAALIGVMTASQFPGLENAALALPTLAMAFPPVLGGVILSGLWAADVSTAIGLLLGISTIVTKDVAAAYLVRDMSEKRQVIFSKIILVLTAGLGLLVALKVESILGFLMQLMTLYSPYALLILAILYCPGLIRKSSCSVTVFAGVVLMVAWAVFPKIRVVESVIYLAVPMCLAAMLLCRVFDRRKINIREILQEK
ncbi:solute:Na+ symporter, SSS family [Eubacterium maltosivorans]|uniref:Sodium:solute symporter family protein n=1 Tax=Eubacterium maltosivorans TaxID=2041044 RepID=A0A4V1GLI5_EUBML|nr:sodium:solute symporter family protein [Eubacterium maltosivorans]QCT69906.1 sodium:solute symporter family protein [Eubacterium maltosivorans]WPK80718.1 Osmoregulated proline transporter OpuE [Eubacterium maltosivorans]SDO27796.1 solute:Na+ symporter, SSS family [Eubacterium maltosivorans]